MTMPAFRYRAFICYSHLDKSWADWLHAALETYRVPRHLVGRETAAGVIPRRLTPVFRDRDELPSATDLSGKVNEALQQSGNLIVICSPRSATSRWANEEVLIFKRLGRADRIFSLIVDGEPNASNHPGRAADECFAPALRYRLGADGQLGTEHTEPIAADMRPGKDGKTNAKLKLISGILDIGLDELKQRELHRRHRRMTAIAAVATGITIITAALAIDALIARRAAERHQKQAEDLVGFMLGDLNDKLGQMQRLDVIEAVDDKAMSYFKSLPRGDVTDAALAQRAKALEKIAGVRTDQGHLRSAMESYQAALNIAAVLANNAPDNEQRQLAYANDWAWVGKTQWSLGELEAASRDFMAAQQVLDRAAALDPNDRQLWFQIVTLDNNIGHVLEAQGHLDDARVQYGNMLGVCTKEVKAMPDNKDWTAELGLAHNNLGKLALMSGELRTAIGEYKADDAIESELLARDPRDNDQRYNVLTVRAILGRTLALAGEVEAGAVALSQAIELAGQLVEFDPQNTTFREHLALYESQLGRLKRLEGQLPAAGDLTTRSIAIFSSLTKSDPGNAAWRREFAEALTEQAAESLADGQTEMARTQAQGALADLEPLLSRQPNERAILLATARARLQLAAAAPDGSLAQRLRQQVLEEALSVKSGQRDPRLLALQAEALLGLRRVDDATPVLGQLADTGYRDVELLTLLRRQRIHYQFLPTTRQDSQAGNQQPR
jgi:eukaryotic-like serine/threonine-protein kinase